MADPAVAVEELVVVRGKRQVLFGLSCVVPAGQVTGLLGPSGSGKTTLLRAIVGVQKVGSGYVTVLGLPAGHRSLRTEIGYMTQAPSVYADLSVRDNLRYFAALTSGADRVDEVLASVDLADRQADRVAQLSGGQRARVSLACALIGSSALLVLDEPTVGLDPVLRQSLWKLFHDLADSGSTVLVSSHVMDEAARCDRLLLLREGSLYADDTPDAIRRQTGAEDLEEAFLRLVAQPEQVS
ncbi:MAG: ABC transporter ATP-binding protein [Jatrophihabitantaceae bacterium]